MKISYLWLKELLPSITASPEEVAETLTMHAYETEVVERWSIDAGVRVVKITTVEPHPNADRLRIATIHDGEKEIRVVCGAPNIQKGHIVPYSPPGTKVRGDDGKAFEIKEVVIRGEKSPGMLNSPRELGLGTDHGGILILPENTPIGTALIDHLPNDVILEADITPNRAHDCLSHLGIARELGALLGLTVKEPALSELPQAQTDVDGFTLDIENDTDTPRYAGVVIKNIENTTSPLCLQARLYAMGAKPISLLVDITNYVMFETGNPSHVFDAGKLPDKRIGVKKSSGEEQLRTLDDEVIHPGADDLVITSGDVPIALAGVMGGLDTGVDADAKDIFLEVANFRAFAVQTAARRHGIHTESSQRFSKGLDPNLVSVATARLVQLITELTGAELRGMLDFYPKKSEQRTVQFRSERVAAISAVNIDDEEIKNILVNLGFQIDDQSEIWNVTAPTVRLDIEGEHDLVEEVIRVYGLTSLPSSTTLIESTQKSAPAALVVRERLRDLLVQHGVTETLNYSFAVESMARLLPQEGEPLRLAAETVALEHKYLRTSLLPGLLANFQTNKDDFHKKFSKQEKALFEIGHVYKKGEGGRVPGVLEEEHAAVMIIGKKEQAAGLLQTLLDAFEVESTDDVVRFLGEVPEQAAQAIKYRLPIAAFELNLDALIKHASEQEYRLLTLEELKREASSVTQYQEFSRYPSVLRDISLFVDPEVSVEQVQELIERVGGEMVVDTDLFDEFEPSSAGKLGLAFHIEYQAGDRTLTDEEVNKVHGGIIRALEDEFAAEIR